MIADPSRRLAVAAIALAAFAQAADAQRDQPAPSLHGYDERSVQRDERASRDGWTKSQAQRRTDRKSSLRRHDGSPSNRPVAPEPDVLAMLGTGAVVLGVAAWRRRRKHI
jgi:hypothetical protein